MSNKNDSLQTSDVSAVVSLIDAIHAGNVLQVHELLRSGDDANQAVDGGRSLVTWAVEFASVPIIRALLDGGAKATPKDAHGEDALERAIAAKRRNVIHLLTSSFPTKRIQKALLQLPYFQSKSANASRPSKFEHPFVKWSTREKQAGKATAEEGQLVTAAEQGDTKMVQRLLESGVNPDAVASSMFGAATPLWAAVNSQRVAVIGLLANAGADLDDELPEAPLFGEVAAGRLEIVRALAEGGANLNATTSNGGALLRSAIEKCHPDIVAELLRQGADPNLRSTLNCPRRDKGVTPLQVAAIMGDQRSFEAIEAAGGTDPRLDALRLCMSAGLGEMATVKRLVESGVDANQKDSLQRTPLACAAATGKAKVAQFLLDHGADVNAVQGLRMVGSSPLLAATIANKVKLVQLLVEAGADLEFKQVEGMTALEYAKRARLKKVAEYLQGVHVSLGGSVEPTGTELRGVPTFDVNDSCVLVESLVDDVARRLKGRVGATVWKKNMVGKSATLTDRCYAVVRFIGIPWTVVLRLKCPVNNYPSADDAQFFSQSLDTRAIHVGCSDTAGVAQYAMYDHGKLQEFFGYGCTSGKESDKRLLEKWYGVDLGEFEKVETKRDMAFVSRLRKLRLESIKNDLDFINDFIKDNNALAPIGPLLGAYDGSKVLLASEDFSDDEIERLDFVAAIN